MKTISKIFFSLLSLFIASPVFAQELPPSLWGALSDPNGTSLDGILSKVLEIIFPAAGLACVVFIVIGGYTWIASAGDPAKVKQAQGTLTWAVIGLVFIIISSLIVSTVMDAAL